MSGTQVEYDEYVVTIRDGDVTTSLGTVQELVRVLDAPEPERVIVQTGYPGPKGPQGPKGDQGPAWAYVHHQESPAATWVIHHDLDGYPSVTVADSSYQVVEGDVVYQSVDVVEVSFSSAFGGSAFFS